MEETQMIAVPCMSAVQDKQYALRQSLCAFIIFMKDKAKRHMEVRYELRCEPVCKSPKNHEY